MGFGFIFSQFWLTAPSIALVETPAGNEVYFWTSAYRPLISTLSLSSRQLTHYLPRYPSPILTMCPFLPFAGVLLVATDRTMRFVAEENSTSECIACRETAEELQEGLQRLLPMGMSREVVMMSVLMAGQAHQKEQFFTSVCFSQLLGLASIGILQEGCRESFWSLFEPLQGGGLLGSVQQRGHIVGSVVQVLSRLVG